ncbi:MAG: hypothetical protein M1834_008866 [Cirrosporium novae-zelandiae]|nr:MAG: hypothetical protein M1834_008866 [Cirrosporium novae-zelandiae]
MATTTTAPSQGQSVQSDIGMKDRFFRYFQFEITALQEQMNNLPEIPPVGGERADAIDHCIAGIAHLSNEVKAASFYLPAYDQRTYVEAIKALSEKLADTRASITPRTKFSFKTARKQPSAISLNDAAEMAQDQNRRLPGYQPSAQSSSSASSSYMPTPTSEDDGTVIVGETNDVTAGTTSNASNKEVVPEITISNSSSISIKDQSNSHIVLPSSVFENQSSGSITNLKSCVADISVATTSSSPLATLTVQNIQQSLLICGQVDGAIHITNTEDSVIVVACRQFRMHQCNNVTVYLLCGSRPIIEDCKGIKFAKLPGYFTSQLTKPPTRNLYDQVDDFKWLKAEHSPNWSLLEPQNAVIDSIWKGVDQTSSSEASIEKVLEVVGAVRR